MDDFFDHIVSSWQFLRVSLSCLASSNLTRVWESRATPYICQVERYMAEYCILHVTRSFKKPLQHVLSKFHIVCLSTLMMFLCPSSATRFQSRNE